MKRFIALLIFLQSIAFMGIPLEAQTPAGNQWALQHLQQDFWKFPVYQNGVYRIDSATLQQAGVLSIPGFDPRKIQLFYNGVEIPVYIEGEQDGVFGSNDFLEFFGKRNDATMDSSFYTQQSYRINKDFSLFTDTSYYFLTVGSTLQNLRLIYEQSVDFTNYLPAEDYFLARAWFEPAGTYASGGYNGDDYSVDSRYMDGEGWVDYPFGIDVNLTNPREVNMLTRGAYQQGPPTELSFSVVGRSKYMFNAPVYPGKHHHVRLKIDGTSLQLDDFTYSGYAVYRKSLTFPSSNLSTGFYTKLLFTGIDDMTSSPQYDATRVDRNSIGRIDMVFPHGNHLQSVTEKYMVIPDHGSKTKTYLSLTNFVIPSGDALLYDFTNGRRIKVASSGSSIQMLIPNSLPGNSSRKECFLTSEGKIFQVNHLKPLSTGSRFIDYHADFSQNQYDFLIITHHSIRTVADQYASYRSLSGYPGLYDPVVVEMEPLYEQFSYGIRNNPLAIENFLKFLYANNELPEKIFVMGKGYSPIITRRDTNDFRNSLVPGWGFPTTDNMYINRLGVHHINEISIGRIAASDAMEASYYLNKVRQYEDTLRWGREMWMKRAIHLGGGNGPLEQGVIRGKLDDWENIYEQPFFGGNVTTFLKATTDPIEINKSQQLKTLINTGVKLMTFYGHGAANGFDISTDEVKTYENEGRYPLVIANSCHSGNLFNKIDTKSEEFVLTDKKGAVAFIGSASSATIPVLNQMSDTLYHQLALGAYGKPIGEMMRSSLRSLVSGTIIPVQTLATYQQSTLHGDPAIVLSVQQKPDYRISEPQVYFTPGTVTNELDSFSIHIISRNGGKALEDTFHVKITRTFPDNSVFDTLLAYPSTAYEDTFVLAIPVNRVTGLGYNTFTIELDAYYLLDESDETNNKVTVPLNIKSANLIPVYPPEFAVIPHNQVTLWASTADPFTSPKKYHFQISNEPGFNHPTATHTVTGGGGVFSWKPPVTFPDSSVWYWRVSIDSAYHPEGVFDWRMSSFRYIENKTGWSQAHFNQFLEDDYQYIKADTAQQGFHFVQDQLDLAIQTGVYPNIGANDQWYSVNSVYQHKSSAIITQNLPGGLIFAVFDTISGKVIVSENNTTTWEGPWGNLQEPNSVRRAFEFPTHTPQWRDKIVSFFDSIPAGYYVLAYSTKDHHAPDFSEDLYQAFESIGSAMIRTLPANTPYAIFGKKGVPIGDPQFVNEDYKPLSTDTINLSYVISSNWNAGHIISKDIGPAKKWNTVFWKQHPYPGDPSNSDVVKYTVIGIDADGLESSFPSLTDLPAHTDSVASLWQTIDAENFPYIRLEVNMVDDQYHTPAQMDEWTVLYTPVPETALDPKSEFTFYADTLRQGDSLWFKIATLNISASPMDSVLVSAWVTDGERKIHQPLYKRYRGHPAGDTLIIDSIGFSTASMASGSSTLWLEVNPVNPQTGYVDQPEQTHLNNLGEKVFFIDKDKRNPLLDVTFDGIHILNEDLVSARPSIEIQLDDDNPFFLFNQPEDTALFRIYVRYPGEYDFTPVYFKDGGVDRMIFYPATGKDNKCRITFPADFTGRDGTYVLRVEAMDKSQNQSGNIHYQISFRVVSEATVTEVLNWPNPFTSKTHFVFTLTGVEAPDDFRIQIMTISGRMVRELTVQELGSVHVGRNITEGYWDGTDEYGDRLANGIYLYRVIVRNSGENLLKASSGADPFFQDGWGKMYLMR